MVKTLLKESILMLDQEELPFVTLKDRDLKTDHRFRMNREVLKEWKENLEISLLTTLKNQELLSIKRSLIQMSATQPI